MEANNKEISYNDIANKVSDIITKDNLTEEDMIIVSLYALLCCDRNVLHTNDLGPVDTKGNEIIQKARSLNTPGSQLLLNTGFKAYEDLTKHQQSSSQTNAYVRTLKNPNFKGKLELDNPIETPENVGINGFTNIILILLITIACGLFLAAILV